MLTKLETILAFALAFLTIDNGLLALYIVNPNVLLMYAGFVFEALFFITMGVGAFYFARIKGVRVIAGE
jgi:hypothetical protein